ncbi:MAG TPA: hypothetical protein VIG40_07460, partial [Tissierellaceae bacterium]
KGCELMLSTSDLIINFDELTNNELINYIFKRHHAFLKDGLKRINDEMFSLFEVYSTEYDYFLEKLYIAFNDLKTNFEIHMVKEEKSIFLHIKEYETNKDEELRKIILKEIEKIEKYNNQIEFDIKEIKRLTYDYTRGTKEHSAFDNMYLKLKELEKETIAHFELERNLIHKRILNA